MRRYGSFGLLQVHAAALAAALLSPMFPPLVEAATITAKAKSNNGSKSSNDDADPDVAWTSGTVKFTATASAKDPLGQVNSAIAHGPVNYRSLGNKKPTLKGSDTGPATGKGSDFAEAGATSPGGHAWGYSYALGHLDTDYIDEYALDVHAYAFGTLGVTDRGLGKSWIDDPFFMSWTDLDAHTLVNSWRMGEGTEVYAQKVPDTYSYASLGIDAGLKLFDEEGKETGQQVFYSLFIDSEGTLDLTLGPGVYIYDGRSLDHVKAQLQSFWQSRGHFYATGDFVVPFAYRTPSGAPGSIAVSFVPEVYAEVATPEPGTFGFYAGGALLLALVAARRKAATGRAVRS